MFICLRIHVIKIIIITMLIDSSNALRAFQVNTEAKT